MTPDASITRAFASMGCTAAICACDDFSNLLVSVCCYCSHVYDVKSAEGASGGVSHGICERCFRERVDDDRERATAGSA